MSRSRMSTKIYADSSAFSVRILGAPLTRLIRASWPSGIIVAPMVGTSIRRLRKILEAVGKENLVQTVRGTGYRFSVEHQEEHAEKIESHIYPASSTPNNLRPPQKKKPAKAGFLPIDQNTALESQPAIQVKRVVVDRIAAQAVIIVHAAVKLEIVDVLRC